MDNDLQMRDSYGAEIAASNWLKTMPFEHVFRNVPHDVFLRRLIEERSLFEGGRLPTSGLTIVIVVNGRQETLQRTLESCILQSALHFNILIVCRDSRTLGRVQQEVKDRLGRSSFLNRSFEGRITYSNSLEMVTKEPCLVGDYLVCIKAGDVFHPSSVTSFCLELRKSSRPADVYFWNEMVVAYEAIPEVKRYLRKPELEPYTLRHLNYISYNFAFAKALLAWFYDFELCLDKNDGHLFLLSVLEKRGKTFVAIPQYLLLRDACNVRAHRELIVPVLSSYRQYFESLDFRVELEEGPAFYSLVPNTTARSVSVIIPFRDRAELTCEALRSVFEQKIDFGLDIVLVNNQSCMGSIDYIRRFAEAHRREETTVRFFNYDLPFNHSAQCNLGAREAQGECVVFLNNDVKLVSQGALAAMASWSLYPGIGTVGVRILDGTGILASAGMILRSAAGADYNSMVEECRNEDFAYYNRETWGNTFACAAMSRGTFESIGPLDEVDFPNGYNDVDYNMRCRKAGLRNIYLGTVCAVHVSGSSRGRSDEVYQKILLRRKYPEMFRDGIFQLNVENRATKKGSSQVEKQGLLNRMLRHSTKGS